MSEREPNLNPESEDGQEINHEGLEAPIEIKWPYHKDFNDWEGQIRTALSSDWRDRDKLDFFPNQDFKILRDILKGEEVVQLWAWEGYRTEKQRLREKFGDYRVYSDEKGLVMDAFKDLALAEVEHRLLEQEKSGEPFKGGNGFPMWKSVRDEYVIDPMLTIDQAINVVEGRVHTTLADCKKDLKEKGYCKYDQVLEMLGWGALRYGGIDSAEKARDMIGNPSRKLSLSMNIINAKFNKGEEIGSDLRAADSLAETSLPNDAFTLQGLSQYRLVFPDDLASSGDGVIAKTWNDDGDVGRDKYENWRALIEKKITERKAKKESDKLKALGDLRLNDSEREAIIEDARQTLVETADLTDPTGEKGHAFEAHLLARKQAEENELRLLDKRLSKLQRNKKIKKIIKEIEEEVKSKDLDEDDYQSGSSEDPGREVA